MHDLRLVREQIHLLRDGFARRGKLDTLGPILDRLEALERDRRALIVAVEDRKARRNTLTADVAQKKRAGEDTTALVADSRGLGDEIARLEGDLSATESTMSGLMLELPNITRDEVPEGDETHNAIVREWGTPRLESGVRPHCTSRRNSACSIWRAERRSAGRDSSCIAAVVRSSCAR